METPKDREKDWQWVWFIQGCVDGPFIKQRYTEIEIGRRGRSKRLYENVYDYVRIVQFGVELIPEALSDHFRGLLITRTI